MTTKDAISLWDASAQEQDYNAPMDADTTVDVAIVGGGFTGLSTALHCAEKGLSAHVLEAKQIGFGGSGRNVGLVNAGVWLPPKDVKAKLGSTYGSRFLKTFGQGPETVFSLIEKHQIRCEVTRTGTIHAAHSMKGFKDLEGRWQDWNAMGEPVDLLDREEVSKLIGSPAFYGGLVDHRAGTINPMGYCRGLARAALGAGAKISTGVTVQALRKDGGHWKVETDRGLVTAKHVVLGTNAYTDTLWPDLKRVFTPIHYFQLATKPMGPEAAHILKGRQGLWDTGQIMFSLRRDAYDRLIIGSMGRVFGDAKSGLSHRWARKQLARIFPDLGDIEFEEAWHGQIAMTPDHMPRIHNLDENLYTAIGYNGRGITTGTIFGKSMSDLLTGMAPDDLPMPMTTMSSVANAPIMSRVYEAAFTANQVLKSL
ncbi:NAD(P)/FAD-dependent oxidoreductase [Tateyamaria pelophila]|uniref:NAD(P)/FAD-dependent oxidoreductase n=1 Tax=Tateyamaria pelophila TaxID=328415 RepID=UPI001CBFC358|nr:FAD-binding oxidoreductase [Tateyamaria pelophila]